MKRLRFFDKVMFVVNSIAAAMLLLSYLLPYIEPSKFSALSVLSLTVPVLIIINMLFAVYWLLKVKRQILLSVFVLLIGYNHVFSLYKFSSSKRIKDAENISVMSYNVRLFNVFNWIDDTKVGEKISELIEAENPDVVCFQEYHSNETFTLKNYYKFKDLTEGKFKTGQAIYSKFPIINSGSVEFPNTSNNAIFIDVLVKQDTVRVYNLHLQSSGINTDVEHLKKESSRSLFKQVGQTFKMQQSQMELFLKHKNKSKHKMIICGDFNNTAYSYVYKEIKADLQDTFQEAGNGFGRTFDFKLFPVRIDFILADPAFTVNGFKTYDHKLSDHYPIKTNLKLN